MSAPRYIEHVELNAVGQLMLDSARVFATAGVNIDSAYLDRILQNRKKPTRPTELKPCL